MLGSPVLESVTAALYFRLILAAARHRSSQIKSRLAIFGSVDECSLREHSFSKRTILGACWAACSYGHICGHLGYKSQAPPSLPCGSSPPAF